MFVLFLCVFEINDFSFLIGTATIKFPTKKIFTKNYCLSERVPRWAAMLRCDGGGHV